MRNFKRFGLRADVVAMPARLAFALVLLLAVAPLSGCTIYDELQASSELMDSMTKGDEKPEAVAAAEAPPDPLEASKQWWKGAQSLSSNEIDSSIASCRLPGGRTQFMKRAQCQARGGTPL